MHRVVYSWWYKCWFVCDVAHIGMPAVFSLLVYLQCSRYWFACNVLHDGLLKCSLCWFACDVPHQITNTDSSRRLHKCPGGNLTSLKHWVHDSQGLNTHESGHQGSQISVVCSGQSVKSKTVCNGWYSLEKKINHMMHYLVVKGLMKVYVCIYLYIYCIVWFWIEFSCDFKVFASD